jgi:hypothetical protein
MIWCFGASASATTYFVSGLGSDSNACTNASPCRTFAGAYAKTTAYDAIDAIAALDSSDFGLGVNLVISHAVTIDGGTHGAFFSTEASGAGITLNLSHSDQQAVIRNITFLIGAGGTAMQVSLVASNLKVDHLSFASTDPQATAFYALLDPASSLDVKSVTISGAGTGFILRPSLGANPQPCQASFEDVTVSSNGAFSTGLTSQEFNLTIRNSTFRSMADGVVSLSTLTSPIVLVENSDFVNNSSVGILFSGGTLRISNSVFSGNATGISSQGGTVISYRNNTFAGNGVDGAPSLSTSLK